MHPCRDAAEKALAAAQRALAQLELAAPKAAQVAKAKREEAADLQARLAELKVCVAVQDELFKYTACALASSRQKLSLSQHVDNSIAVHLQPICCLQTPTAHTIAPQAAAEVRSEHAAWLSELSSQLAASNAQLAKLRCNCLAAAATTSQSL